jgi:hypothetical protein
MVPPLVLVGKKAIGAAIGRGPGEVMRLIKEDNLPCWKERDCPNAPWYARPEDLQEWVAKRSQKYLTKKGKNKKSCQ